MQGGGWIYPTFLFFEFLKFGFVYRSEIFHGNKTFKMPSDEYWNIDIYAETDIEMYKKLFRTRYSYVRGVDFTYTKTSRFLLWGVDFTNIFKSEIRSKKWKINTFKTEID